MYENLSSMNKIALLTENISEFLPSECIDPYCRLFIIKPPSFLRFINCYEKTQFYKELNNHNLLIITENNVIVQYKLYNLLMNIKDDIMRKMRGLYKERRNILGTENGDDKSGYKFSVRSYGRKCERLRAIKKRIGITE